MPSFGPTPASIWSLLGGSVNQMWFATATAGLWFFNAYQRWRLGSKICITPVKTPLNNIPIESRIIGGIVGGGLRNGGLGGGLFGNWNVFDFLELIEGTVTSTYKLEPPKTP